MKKIWKIIIDVVFVACAVVTVGSTVVYQVTGKVVPGLSPFTLAAVLCIVSFGMHDKRIKTADGEKEEGSGILEIVFFVACILNVFVGLMQIHAYIISR